MEDQFENFGYDRQENSYGQMPHYQDNRPPRKGNRPGTGRVIALALVCSLVGGAVGAGGLALWQSGNRQEAAAEAVQPEESPVYVLQGIREAVVIETVPVNTDNLMSPAQVYAANVNSTVGITTSVTTNYWGYQTTSAASGSGFILTSDGYILTNHHVVENSDSITVSLYDGTAYQAELVGFDESNDLAVLKVDAENLPPVILGNSDNMNVGDSVVAIGNPLGELTFSLTAGTVSALERQVTMSSGVTMNLMQTDCAINSGNSGGALFNLYGEVVGITNAKYSGSSQSEASIDNIGFAIPINAVRNIAWSIIEKGYIVKPYIGVSVVDVSAETQSYGLPGGAAVKAISPESPAEAAGLQVSDIITHVDGAAVSGSSQLVRIVGEKNPGERLSLTVYRSGKTMTLELTVGEQIQSALEEETGAGYAQSPWRR